VLAVVVVPILPVEIGQALDVGHWCGGAGVALWWCCACGCVWASCWLGTSPGCGTWSVTAPRKRSCHRGRAIARTLCSSLSQPEPLTASPASPAPAQLHHAPSISVDRPPHAHAAMASTTAASSRDVDTLDALPDRQILLQDQEYLVGSCAWQPRVRVPTTALPPCRARLTRRSPVLNCVQARHSLDKLFSGLMLQLLMQKPADPLQFVIDTLSLSPQEAAQVPHGCRAGARALALPGRADAQLCLQAWGGSPLPLKQHKVASAFGCCRCTCPPLALARRTLTQACRSTGRTSCCRCSRS
jgi:hypothetical protein